MNTSIRTLIPLLLIGGFVIFSWVIFLSTDYQPVFQHYLTLLLFAPLVYLFFTRLKWATVLTGVFLLLATINLLPLTPGIETTWVSIGKVILPSFQFFGLMILIVYAILNFDVLTEIYLDYKDAKSHKETRK